MIKEILQELAFEDPNTGEWRIKNDDRGLFE